MIETLLSFALLSLLPVIAGFSATVMARTIGFTDVSNTRSSHSGTALTAGGVSVVAAFLTMMGVQYFNGPDGIFTLAYTGLIGLAVGMAVLGLYDDIRGARSLPKLVFMMATAIVACVLIGPMETIQIPLVGTVPLPLLTGLVISTLWIVVVVNAVNFIDGANGMLVCTMSVGALGLLILSAGFSSEMSPWAWSLLLGLLCFAPFNFRNSAAMFAGDVGALTAGFIFAVGGLLLLQDTPELGMIYIFPLLILPILIDVFMTLIRRTRAGENLLQAHNQHLFQRQIQAGASHLRVSVSYMLASIISTLCAVMCMHAGWPHSFFVLIFGVIVGVAIYIPLYSRAMRNIQVKIATAS